MTNQPPADPPKPLNLAQMMQNEKQVALVNCDGCHTQLATPHLIDADALIYAHVLGWKRVGKQDFCPKCAGRK